MPGGLVCRCESRAHGCRSSWARGTEAPGLGGAERKREREREREMGAEKRRKRRKRLEMGRDGKRPVRPERTTFRRSRSRRPSKTSPWKLRLGRAQKRRPDVCDGGLFLPCDLCFVLGPDGLRAAPPQWHPISSQPQGPSQTLELLHSHAVLATPSNTLHLVASCDQATWRVRIRQK